MFAGMGAGRRLDRCRAPSKARCLNCQTQPWPGRCLVLVSPSHGENRGSSPLGSANNFKALDLRQTFVSNACPINVCGHAETYRPTALHRPMEANGRWPVPGLHRSPGNRRSIFVVNLSRTRESGRLDYI